MRYFPAAGQGIFTLEFFRYSHDDAGGLLRIFRRHNFLLRVRSFFRCLFFNARSAVFWCSLSRIRITISRARRQACSHSRSRMCSGVSFNDQQLLTAMSIRERRRRERLFIINLCDFRSCLRRTVLMVIVISVHE